MQSFDSNFCYYPYDDKTLFNPTFIQFLLIFFIRRSLIESMLGLCGFWNSLNMYVSDNDSGRSDVSAQIRCVNSEPLHSCWLNKCFIDICAMSDYRIWVWLNEWMNHDPWVGWLVACFKMKEFGWLTSSLLGLGET